MKCQREHCQKHATHYPMVCVPAVGHDPTRHKPLECMVGVKVCKEHARSFDVPNWLDQKTPTGDSTIRDAFSAVVQGRSPLDFDKAHIRAIPLRHKQAQRFRASMAIASQANVTNQPVSASH